MTSAVSGETPEDKRPSFIISTREALTLRDWGGKLYPCWSSATVKDWTGGGNELDIWLGGLGTTRIEQRRERLGLPCLCIDSEELPLRPAGEGEDTDKGIPTFPTGETKHLLL